MNQFSYQADPGDPGIYSVMDQAGRYIGYVYKMGSKWRAAGHFGNFKTRTQAAQTIQRSVSPMVPKPPPWLRR